MAATLLDLENDVYNRALISVTQKTDTDRAINAAYKEIVGLLQLNPLEQAVALTGGSDSYNINTMLLTAKGIQDFSALIGMYFQLANGGSTGPMEPVDLPTLMRQRALFLANGTPYLYCVTGNAGLEVFPVPTTTGDTLVLWYAAFNPAVVASGGNTLAAAGDSPSLIPDEFHDVIALGASYKIASVRESAGDNKDLAIRLKAEYDQRLGEFRAWKRKHESSQPRRLKVGYPRFARVRPATPSTDYFSTRW